jgi:hypothetical protein
VTIHYDINCYSALPRVYGRQIRYRVNFLINSNIGEIRDSDDGEYKDYFPGYKAV